MRTGYVEAVAVHPDHRRQGHGGVVMAGLERVIVRAYELGALAATDDGAKLYAARGWQAWRGPTQALTPKGVVRTPGEDGEIWVYGGDGELDLDSPLTCDWREGALW